MLCAFAVTTITGNILQVRVGLHLLIHFPPSISASSGEQHHGPAFTRRIASRLPVRSAPVRSKLATRNQTNQVDDFWFVFDADDFLLISDMSGFSCGVLLEEFTSYHRFGQFDSGLVKSQSRL